MSFHLRHCNTCWRCMSGVFIVHAYFCAIQCVLWMIHTTSPTTVKFVLLVWEHTHTFYQMIWFPSVDVVCTVCVSLSKEIPNKYFHIWKPSKLESQSSILTPEHWQLSITTTKLNIRHLTKAARPEWELSRKIWETVFWKGFLYFTVTEYFSLSSSLHAEIEGNWLQKTSSCLQFQHLITDVWFPVSFTACI